MAALTDRFEKIWAVDFEFTQPPGERPTPICMTAKEFKSGREIRWWQGEREPVELLACGQRDLFVAFYASAEIGCYLVLGWPLPANVVDLFCEFRALTNGLSVAGNSLLAALQHMGGSQGDAVEKQIWREVAIRGAPFSSEERYGLLDYCSHDVSNTCELLTLFLPELNNPQTLARALNRGRYMKSAAAVELEGIPIDTQRLEHYRERREDLRQALIDEFHLSWVYPEGSFREATWRQWCESQGLGWPVTRTGRLALDDETFKRLSFLHPVINDLRQLRDLCGKLESERLRVGKDHRARCGLSAFQAVTSRNAPPTSGFVFGQPHWFRSVIRPEPGHVLAY